MIEWPLGVDLLKVSGPKYGIVIFGKGPLHDKPEIERDKYQFDKLGQGS